MSFEQEFSSISAIPSPVTYHMSRDEKDNHECVIWLECVPLCSNWKSLEYMNIHFGLEYW